MLDLYIPKHIEYLLLDSDLTIVQTSKQIRRLAEGSDVETIIGRDVRSSFPELVGIEAILTKIEAGDQDSFELQGLTRLTEEKVIYFDLWVQKAREYLLVCCQDVSETYNLRQSITQRANQAELLLNQITVYQSYLQNILTSMQDSLIVTDANGQIKNVNGAVVQLFGYSEAELINSSITKIIASKQLDSVYELLTPAAVSIGNLEFVCQTKSGESAIIEFSCASVPTEVKQILDVVFIGRDITAKKQAEEQTLAALQKEKELHQLKSRFVATASHEFRNPLSSILMCVELLSQEQLEASTQKLYLQYIKTAANSMKSLLQDILILGKAEAGKLHYKIEKLDLVQICQELVAEISLTTARSIKFSASQPQQFVEMDRKLLRHIIINLLSNAVKYSPEGEPVEFELQQEENAEWIVMTFRDRGIGIPPEDMNHLFESFHRAKNVGEINGTGLGLSIVKKSVDICGGEIACDSLVGEGTTFRVRLPIKNTLNQPTIDC